MDRCSHSCREQGHHLQRLSESHAAHTPPAPADPCGHLVSDADTTHHRLLPGVLHLQKMALRTRQGFPLRKEVRASQTLTKVLGWVTISHCLRRLCGVGRPRGSRAQSRSRARSIISHRSRRSGSAQSQVTDNGQETISESKPSHQEEAPCEDEDAEASKGDAEVLSNPAPRTTCPPRTQVGHLPRKSSQLTRPSATRPGNELGSWTQILMLGGAKRLLRALQAGPQETP